MKIALAAEKQQQSKDGYEAFKKYYKRIRMYLYCTFLCHSILGVLYFRLCFNYLQNPKTNPQEFFSENLSEFRFQFLAFQVGGDNLTIGAMRITAGMPVMPYTSKASPLRAGLRRAVDCIYKVKNEPHLLGSFESTHQSRSPLRSIFVNPKHIKNLRPNLSNLLFHHHLNQLRQESGNDKHHYSHDKHSDSFLRTSLPFLKNNTPDVGEYHV